MNCYAEFGFVLVAPQESYLLFYATDLWYNFYILYMRLTRDEKGEREPLPYGSVMRENIQ